MLFKTHAQNSNISRRKNHTYLGSDASCCEGYPTLRMFSHADEDTANSDEQLLYSHLFPVVACRPTYLSQSHHFPLRRRLDPASSSPSLAIAWQTNTPTSGSRYASIADSLRYLYCCNR